MEFYITIVFESRRLTFLVKRTEVTDSNEFYEVIGGNKTIVLKNNWPVLKRHNLKHRVPEWKLKSGVMRSRDAIEKITEAIYKKIKTSDGEAFKGK